MTAPLSDQRARYSIPPAALGDYLERYQAAPDGLEAHELLMLARAFERMGCDEQALDCADRAARLDPDAKPEAVEVARRCVGRPSRPT